MHIFATMPWFSSLKEKLTELRNPVTTDSPVEPTKKAGLGPFA